MGKQINRRNFVKGSIAAGVALSAGMLSGCSNDASDGAKGRSSSDTTSIKWDYETDMVIVGAGTSLLGALLATAHDYTVTIVEKASVPGGTTRLSGGGVWAPLNKWGKEDGYIKWTEDEAFEYLKQADLLNGSTDEAKWDYIRNMRKIMEVVADDWGYEVASDPTLGNYDKAANCYEVGSSLLFRDEEGVPQVNANFIGERFVPTLEERGATILTDAEVVDLIKNEEGRVIGVKAQTSDGEIYAKGEKGILLAAGGFDHNKEMREKYLLGPYFGTLVPTSNTGDGIRLGQALGADLGNMQSTLGGSCFISQFDSPEDFDTYLVAYDFGGYRASAHGMLVNSRGRRFMDESTPYSIYPPSTFNYDSRAAKHTNIPAYFIFSDKHVEIVGWPNGEDSQPDYVGKFDSLSELAAAYEIDEAGLSAEIERFNRFCDEGTDPDFGRGESPWVSEFSVPFAEGEEGVVLGRIEAPYYVALVAPGSLGTKGGLKVNLDCQVIDVKGEVIPGLYCSGTNASGILGSTYGGAGGGVGPGFFQAFKAVDRALGINAIEWE